MHGWIEDAYLSIYLSHQICRNHGEVSFSPKKTPLQRRDSPRCRARSQFALLVSNATQAWMQKMMQHDLTRKITANQNCKHELFLQI